MSIVDIFQSIALGFSSTLLSSSEALVDSNGGGDNDSGANTAASDEFPGDSLIIGTDDTCTLQGTFVQLGFIVHGYTAALCFYYLCVIKWNMRAETLKKIEPLMHAGAVLPSLIIAIIAASTNMIHNSYSMCYVAHSDGQDHEQDTQMSLWPFYLLNSFILAVLIIDFLLISISMYLIIQTVRESETKMMSYSFQRPGRSSIRANGNRSSNRSSNTSKFNDLSKTTNDTFKQAFIYITGFFVTRLFFTINVVLMNFCKIKPPPLFFLLQCLTLPLQGFWNFCAYIRPRYYIIKAEQAEDEGFLQILYRTIMKEPDKVPERQMNSSLRHSTLRNMSRLQRVRRAERLFASTNSRTDNNQLRGSSPDDNEGAPRSDNVSCKFSSPRLYTKPNASATTRHMNNCIRELDEEETQETTKESKVHKAKEIDMAEVNPTLSLLIAQDLLPIQHGEFRRRSMIDLHRFPLIDLNDNSDDEDNLFFSGRGEERFNQVGPSRGDDQTSRKQSRRYSCPSMHSY